MYGCLAYLLGLIAAWAVLWEAADQWWPATVLLFAPRWAMGLPLILLVPLSLSVHRRSLLTLAAAGAVLIWPILQLRIPLHGVPDDDQTPFLRVVTCNVHRHALSDDEFKAVLDDVRPDLVALQDWSADHGSQLFNAGSWNCRRDGELFVASRYPILEARPIPLDEPPPVSFLVRLGTAAYYRIQTPLGALDVINVHLASPHEALDAMMHFDPTSPRQLEYNTQCRDLESASIERFVSQLLGKFVILGDFNTPRESAVYRQYWEQYADAFSTSGFGFGATHVSTLSSVRIDHILMGDGWASRKCWTAHPAGSPHRPLVADLQLTADPGAVASGSEP
jgi:endonuclease/exonuclease/phosphatase family metal-dependent hydrolase